MQCLKCQLDNPETAAFCARCGTALATLEMDSKSRTVPCQPEFKDLGVGLIIDGKYKLLEELGSGGMGVVYLADQLEPVRRRAALKIIKLGMDTREVVARFEAERQALAVMDHTNIAKVFDAGATETGRPYFVMELVRGLPITEYCDRHRLSTRERLELIIPVCQAVQHAHQKGVIHRDLKPSNILVSIQDDKPVPKIIDFGIAKATEHHLTQKTVFTEQGLLIGTPEYMSPEQAEMTGLDIDTRTDIYALGVTLYELLVGVLPFDPQKLRSAGFGEIQRIIREVEPPKASTRLNSLKNTQVEIAAKRKTDPGALEKELRGDLDWITMKAMAKDRTQRYASASELAADIERYLKQEPVLAGRPGAVYRLKKYVLRHKIGVAAAGVVFLAIVIAIIGTSIGLVKATRAEKKAVAEAKTAQTVSDFLVEIFAVSDPSEARGNTITAREILDKGAERIEKELAGQPPIQARLMDTIGKVYMSLGLYEQAVPMLDNALKVKRTIYKADNPDIAESLHSQGDLYRRQGKYEQAESAFKRALAVMEKAAGPESFQVAEVLHSLGILYDTQGKYPEAESVFKRSLAIREKTAGMENADVARSLNSLAIVYWNQGKYAEAETGLQRSLVIKEKALGPDHPDLSNSLTNLAILYKTQGKYAQAEPLLKRALAIEEKVLGPDHPDVGSSLNNLAALYEEQGKYAEAESLYRRTLTIWEKALGTDHSDVGIVLHNLANLLRNQGMFVEAEPLYKRSLAIWEKSLGPQHPYVSVSLREQGNLYREMGKFSQAESFYKQAIALQEKMLGAEHLELAMSFHDYAVLLEKTGRKDEAGEFEARAKAIQEKK